MTSSRQHITAHLMYLAPSAGNVSKFGLCNKNSFRGVNAKTAWHYIFGDAAWRRSSYWKQTHLWATYQIGWLQHLKQRFTHVREQLHISTDPGFSYKWESQLSQLVQANAEGFSPCHKEWLNPCPNEISMETKECITCLWLLQVRPMKTSSMTPIFKCRSRWGALSPYTQKW